MHPRIIDHSVIIDGDFELDGQQYNWAMFKLTFIDDVVGCSDTLELVVPVRDEGSLTKDEITAEARGRARNLLKAALSALES